MNETKDEVKKIIRALLLAAKHGLTVNELCVDYAAVICKPLPYKELGYHSAIDLVKDIPDVVRPAFSSGGVMILHGIADASTKHISELVQRQKSSNSRIVSRCNAPKPTKNIVPNFIRSKILQLISCYHGGLKIELFEEKYRKEYGKKLLPNLLGFVSTHQLLEACSDIAAVKVIKGHVFVFPSTTEDNKPCPTKPAMPVEFLPTIGILNDLKQQIKEILMRFENGIWSARFPFEFKNYYNKPFDTQNYGFTSIVELMAKLPELVLIKRPMANSDWLLFPKNRVEDAKVEKLLLKKSQYKLCDESQLDDLIEIYLSYIIDPATFWFQHSDHFDELERMSEQLNLFYHGSKSDHLRIKYEDVEPNQPCSALYSDGKWYRAAIRCVLSQRKAQVFYVDYGNETDIDISALRRLEKQFFMLPCQAVRGKLYGTLPDEGNAWSKNAIQKFFDLTQDKYLFGRVMDKQNVIVLDIIDTNSNIDIYVADEMKGVYHMKENLEVSAATRDVISAFLLSALSSSPAPCLSNDETLNFLQGYYTVLKQIQQNIESNKRKNVSNEKIQTTDNLPSTSSPDTTRQINNSPSSSTPDTTRQLNNSPSTSTPDTTRQINNLPSSSMPDTTRQKDSTTFIYSNQKYCLKRINISDDLKIHIIRYNDQPYCTSAEISNLFWDGDVLRQMLRQKSIDVLREKLSQKENPELFSLMARNKVLGIVSGEDIRPYLYVYKVQSLAMIVDTFPEKYSGCGTLLKAEVEKFQAMSNYWVSEVHSEEETIEQIILKLQLLRSKRKRLHLSMMANIASESTLADLQQVNEEILSVERTQLSLFNN